MEIICIQGAAPGAITATVTHMTHVRQLPMVVARHPSGGWTVRGSTGEWGPRCHAVSTAILLDAADAFMDGPAHAASVSLGS